MKKKKGFTLVELLAVIVILAVILVIAVPQIMSVIESARKGSIESTAKLIAEGAEREYTNRKILGKDTNIYTPQFSIGSFIDQNIQALRAKLKKYYFKQKESYNYFILYIVNGTKQHAFIKSSTS